MQDKKRRKEILDGINLIDLQLTNIISNYINDLRIKVLDTVPTLTDNETNKLLIILIYKHFKDFKNSAAVRRVISQLGVKDHEAHSIIKDAYSETDANFCYPTIRD